MWHVLLLLGGEIYIMCCAEYFVCFVFLAGRLQRSGFLFSCLFWFGFGFLQCGLRFSCPCFFFLMLFRILGEILCLGTRYVIIGFGSASPLWLCFFSFSFVGYLVLYIYTSIYLFVCVLLWLLFCLLVLTVGWLVGLRGG